jgi:hypothetical protein
VTRLVFLAERSQPDSHGLVPDIHVFGTYSWMAWPSPAMTYDGEAREAQLLKLRSSI